MATKSWSVSTSQILTRAEIQLVLKELHRKGKRFKLTRRNLIIFRLSTCCGLRVGELTQLKLSNIHLGARKLIHVPAAISKADKNGKRRKRDVPLHWDQGTLNDIEAWKNERIADGAKGSDLFVCTKNGTRIGIKNARRAFQACCRILERPVTIHMGRHSFISHAIHNGKSLGQVREAAGHASIATTDIYTHLVQDDDGEIGSIFG